jgi:hypothetical protein
MLHQVLKQGKFAPGVIITFQVMAFAGMSPGYPDTVGALAQSGHEKLRIHSSGAGYSNHPYIGRIFHSPDTCQVGSTVAAPVAQEGDDFGFPIGHVHTLLFLGCWFLSAS